MFLSKFEFFMKSETDVILVKSARTKYSCTHTAVPDFVTLCSFCTGLIVLPWGHNKGDKKATKGLCHLLGLHHVSECKVFDTFLLVKHYFVNWCRVQGEVLVYTMYFVNWCRVAVSSDK